MAYLAPSEFVTKMVDAGESKIGMNPRDALIRAYMAGAILALEALDVTDPATLDRESLWAGVTQVRSRRGEGLLRTCTAAQGSCSLR